jgi:hypothetical protein
LALGTEKTLDGPNRGLGIPQNNRETDMAENTGIDTVHDDDLADEALDRTNGAKACGSPVASTTNI